MTRRHGRATRTRAGLRGRPHVRRHSGAGIGRAQQWRGRGAVGRTQGRRLTEVHHGRAAVVVGAQRAQWLLRLDVRLERQHVRAVVEGGVLGVGDRVAAPATRRAGAGRRGWGAPSCRSRGRAAAHLENHLTLVDRDRRAHAPSVDAPRCHRRAAAATPRRLRPLKRLQLRVRHVRHTRLPRLVRERHARRAVGGDREVARRADVDVPAPHGQRGVVARWGVLCAPPCSTRRRCRRTRAPPPRALPPHRAAPRAAPPSRRVSGGRGSRARPRASPGATSPSASSRRSRTARPSG